MIYIFEEFVGLGGVYDCVHISRYKEGKVFYGQEPPSGESPTTECEVNYQLLAVITEVAQWRIPTCSRPQPATYNGVSDGRSNCLVALPTLICRYPLSPRA